MLTHIPKISPKTREDNFKINFPENGEQFDKSALMEILEVFVMLPHFHWQSVLCNSAF